MGTAVSLFRSARKPSGSENDLKRGNGISEVALELLPTPFVDAPLTLVEADQVLPRERSEGLSRALNVCVAAAAMIVAAPIMLLIALAIRLTSKGPIFYSQIRVGVDRRWRSAGTYDRRSHDHGGRLFKMYKFRSMRVDAEADGKAVWARQGDPRITPVGRFLRKTRLDELPQLYNVLRGEMNIVGPRPERPTIFAQLRDDIPQYAMRQRIKPDITG